MGTAAALSHSQLFPGAFPLPCKKDRQEEHWAVRTSGRADPVVVSFQLMVTGWVRKRGPGSASQPPSNHSSSLAPEEPETTISAVPLQ